jgi:hypothetical protein
MSEFNQFKIDPDQSWQVAASTLKESIHFSSSFTTTIRALKQNQIENAKNGLGPKKLNTVSKFNVMRLFRAGSIKAPLYYLTCTFKSREIDDREFITLEELVGLYTLEELSAILALAYTYNCLRRICDKEEWQKQAKFINECLEVGGYLGLSLPHVGLANGILLTGMRCLAPAIYLARNQKIYKNYRRDLKIKKAAFDLQMEYDLFGCTHVDIATQMLQAIGYGVDIPTDFYKSLVTSPNKPLDKKPNTMRIMLLWVEALYLGKKPPAINGENEISLGEDVMDQLLMVSKQVQESGSAFSWLSKGRSSITKQLAPVLYAGAKRAANADTSEQESQATA